MIGLVLLSEGGGGWAPYGLCGRGLFIHILCFEVMLDLNLGGIKRCATCVRSQCVEQRSDAERERSRGKGHQRRCQSGNVCRAVSYTAPNLQTVVSSHSFGIGSERQTEL